MKNKKQVCVFKLTIWRQNVSPASDNSLVARGVS